MASRMHGSATTSPTGGRETTGADPPLGSGDFALDRIQQQVKKLRERQAEVLADDDPEALHQLRVALRRLRTALGQFGPALELPKGVTESRIAQVARRTGRCRDLDVLRLRLREQILPRLPSQEQAKLHGALAHLKHDRSRAFHALRDELLGPRFRKLLDRLQQWMKDPRYTPLGELPLLPWISDWQAPVSAGLFLLPGWRVEDPAAEELHALRKRIKAVRYSLENLQPWCEPPVEAWMQDLRQAQAHLGELHDLHFLRQRLETHSMLRRVGGEGASPRARGKLPVLQAVLAEERRGHWLRWRELAERLQEENNRLAIQRHLLELGRGSSATG